MSDIRLQIGEGAWVPKYIPIPQTTKPRDLVDNTDWNKEFNLRREQGNWNSETLEALINTGLLSVKRADYATNAGLLEGKPASYFAARENVLGLDEHIYRPGSTWKPTMKEQPANKLYVDDIFDEYTVKYTSGIIFKGIYDTYAEFIKAHPKGEKGDAYIVNNHIYAWDERYDRWYDAGPLTGPKGEEGKPGSGVPTGGEPGQFLQKKTTSDYEVQWSTVSFDGYMQSDTTERFTAGPNAPANPKKGDIWFKI